MLPSNYPGEDRRSSATCLPGGAVLLGVFDGHGGAACVNTVSQRLFYYITVATLPPKTLGEMERALEEERAVPPLLEWHKHPQDRGYLDGGATSFHSLRNYWQERLAEDLEVDLAHDSVRSYLNILKLKQVFRSVILTDLALVGYRTRTAFHLQW